MKEIIWILPLAWTITLYFVARLYNRYVHGMPIVRQIPADGFVDDAARVRFWKTEPFYQRERWKTQALPRFIGIWVAGVALIFVYLFALPVGVGLTLALAGVVLWIRSRRKPSPVGVRVTLYGGFWVYGTM